MQLTMHSLKDLWDEASTSRKCTNLSYKTELSYIYKGIKICNVNNNIKIYNAGIQRYAYKELTEDEYQFLYDNGFIKGVHLTKMGNYKNKISILNKKIKNEINTRNNKKHYDSLKIKRENLINKYTQISKLN